MSPLRGVLVPLAIITLTVVSQLDAVAAEETQLRKSNPFKTTNSNARPDTDAPEMPIRSVLRSCALLGMIGGVIAFTTYEVKRLMPAIGAKNKGILEGLDHLNPRVVMTKLFYNIFFLYALFLLTGSVLYYRTVGTFQFISWAELLDFGGSVAESLGLLLLRHKITKRKSVRGISESCMSMFLIAYILRCYELFPKFKFAYANHWVLWAFCFVSLLQVLDILIAVFVTYRSTYQEELDVLKTKHILPIVMAASVLIHPGFDRGFVYSVIWTLTFYSDVAALIPQVVMMAQGAGKVEAPISHFVAATALSRGVDLYFWWVSHEFGPQGYIFGFNYSGWLIVVVHIVNLLIVADFLYYYLKARFSGSALNEDLALPI